MNDCFRQNLMLFCSSEKREERDQINKSFPEAKNEHKKTDFCLKCLPTFNGAAAAAAPRVMPFRSNVDKNEKRKIRELLTYHETVIKHSLASFCNLYL
jgi:hypothetical protein